MTNEVDTHDPAGMAAWLRERKAACLEFYKLDSEEQQRQFLNRWQQNVLPHLAFRFGQAAEMVEQLAAECDHLRSQIPNMPADEPRERRPMTLDDAGYAPGGYIIKCRDCDTQTWDCDKRAIRCEPCAMRLLAAENRGAEHE